MCLGGACENGRQRLGPAEREKSARRLMTEMGRMGRTDRIGLVSVRELATRDPFKAALLA